MNNISTVSTKKAPQAIGPYSQGVTANGFLFVSGQLPLDPETGRLVEGNISIRAEQIFRNMEAIIDASGASMSNVVKISLFLTDMNDFKAVNDVYSKYFNDPFPARSTIQVAALPLGSDIEAEAFVCIA